MVRCRESAVKTGISGTYGEIVRRTWCGAACAQEVIFNVKAGNRAADNVTQHPRDWHAELIPPSGRPTAAPASGKKVWVAQH